MRIKIRTKLVLVISILIIILFSVTAKLFIDEKKIELADDIYLNTLAFSKLTAANISYNYDLYLKQNSFIYFNREIKKIFAQNDNLENLKVTSYTGEILYDSTLDIDKKYEGKSRTIDDPSLIEQIQSENISIRTMDNKIIYLKSDISGKIYFVDKNEKKIDFFKKGFLIKYFVLPASEKHSIIYSLTYHNLDQRISNMINRIIYLVLFGIMLGIITSFILSMQLTKPIISLVKAAGDIAKGKFETKVLIKTHDELRFLGDSFNQMALDLQKGMNARLYQERVTHELELAEKIQKKIVPTNIPQIEGLEIAADLIPAGEIGGDMYDFISLSEKKLMFYLGDVTGHGVPAGIVSSIANALFFGYSNLSNLKDIVVSVNKVLAAKTMPNIFMTLCLMQWDKSKSEFSYVNAGHEQIIHYNSVNKEVGLFSAGGIALGMLTNISNHLTIQTAKLRSGDFLIIYSDGIPEAWKNEKELYGIERFMETVRRNGLAKTAESLKDAILEDLRNFVQNYEQKDDITIIVIKKL